MIRNTTTKIRNATHASVRVAEVDGNKFVELLYFDSVLARFTMEAEGRLTICCLANNQHQAKLCNRFFQTALSATTYPAVGDKDRLTGVKCVTSYQPTYRNYDTALIYYYDRDYYESNQMREPGQRGQLTPACERHLNGISIILDPHPEWMGKHTNLLHRDLVNMIAGVVWHHPPQHWQYLYTGKVEGL